MADSTSLNPSSFADDSGLLDMSLESAFLLYHKRNQDSKKDDKSKPVSIHCRQVVRGSIFSLRMLSRKYDVSFSELVLSTSFKVLAELQAVGIVSRLSKSYNTLLEDGIRNALFDELAVVTSGYNITYRDGHSQGWFPVYPEVHSALNSVADGCGTDVPRLYQVGLAIALSKSEECVADGLLCKASNEIFRPEVLSFMQYMARWRKTLDDGLLGGKKG